MKSKNEQIKMCLEDIDFKLIHETIKSNGWVWFDVDTKEKSVPTMLDLSKAAEDCMRGAFNSENKICRNGRFEAEVIEGILAIRYVLAQASPLNALYS